MRNHDCGELVSRLLLNLLDVLNGRLNLMLALRVESGSGLVENQDLGVLDQSPCDCEPLLLPTRKILDGRRANVRVQSVLHELDELGIGLC